MPLENANQISELNPAYPVGSDPIGQGDDHIRMMKEVLLQFYNNEFRQVVEKSYAQDGLVLVSGSFEQGGTVTAPNQVLLYEFEGIAYAWEGAFPKVVPPASTPAGSGGIGPGFWVTKSGVLDDTVSVLQEGAIADSSNGLDGTDSTAAFNAAIAKCLSTGKALRIPKMLKGYRLTSTVNFRGVNVLPNNSTLYINHAGIGILFGGNASNPNNPSQSFGTITRVTGTAGLSNPDMRGIGLKGQHIYVERCDYLQLYADDLGPASTTDYSCAYSTLILKFVGTVQLYGVNNGWMNENIFYLNRTNKILFVNGTYAHNHNKFYNGTMEGIGIIDLPIGSNNYFYGYRFERSGSNAAETLNINFGPGTWENIIEVSWRSSPGYSNEAYNPIGTQVTVNDQGRGNSVFTTQDLYSDEVTIFALSEATPFVSVANNQTIGLYSKNTDIRGLRYVQHLVNNKFRVRANFANMLKDDRKIPVRNGDMFMLSSDVQILRPLIYLYDLAGNWIQTEPADPNIISFPGKAWNVEGYFTLGVNQTRVPITIGNGVSAVVFQLNTGNATDNIIFSNIRLTARFHKDNVNTSRKIFGIPPMIRESALFYNTSADIDMANVGERIPCYKIDMTEMKINAIRQRYLVRSVSGNVITVSGGGVQYFEPNLCQVVYTDGVDNFAVPVQAVSGSTITLVNPAPAAIVAGVNIDFMLTKTKTLL